MSNQRRLNRKSKSHAVLGRSLLARQLFLDIWALLATIHRRRKQGGGHSPRFFGLTESLESMSGVK